MTSPGKPEPWVWLARIRRPQGRKGEVFAEILTDYPEKFAQRRRLWLMAPTAAAAPARGEPGGSSRSAAPAAAPRAVELANHWLHKGGAVLHFAGVDSISAAEQLAGMIVAIPRDQRVALPEDEAYIADLVGCVLVDVARAGQTNNAGVRIGEIVDVDRTTGAAPLLIVEGAAGEVLIPFAKSYLRRIDLKNKRVEMALPEGLVDLNAPEKQETGNREWE